MLAFPSNHYKEKAIRNKSTPKLGAYTKCRISPTKNAPKDSASEAFLESFIQFLNIFFPSLHMIILIKLYPCIQFIEILKQEKILPHLCEM